MRTIFDKAYYHPTSHFDIMNKRLTVDVYHVKGVINLITYGKAFKILREQKQLALSYFEQVGVNKGDLSRFENGKVMMGFERIDLMLQAMNVSLSEYEFLLNHHVMAYQDEFFSQLEAADFSQDQAKLSKLYAEALSSGDPHVSVAVKACQQVLDRKSCDRISDLLNKVSKWGYFELSLAYFTLRSLPTSELLLFCQEFENKCGNYITIPKYYRRIYQIAYHAVIVLSLRKEVGIAKHILQLTDYPQLGHTDFYIATLKELAEGVVTMTFDDRMLGKQKINAAFDLMARLGSRHLVTYYQKEIGTDTL